VIDIVSITPDGGSVELHMVQSSKWTGSRAQLLRLQDKLNNYASFALDGQLAKMYPSAAGLPWRIVLQCQTEPHPDVTDFIRRAKPLVEKDGGQLALRMRSNM
jgi:hypothetical protein